VLLDFFFMMLEGLSWRPDYLPSSNRGLPQVKFDAPRLLAHAFLFEVDAYLKEKTNDRFLRWVDDITIPIDSTSQAAEFIHGVDELLMTRGLRLNSGKTITLPAREAAEYLQRDENIFLDIFEGRIKRVKHSGGNLADEAARLQARFAAFEQKRRFGHWDKVLKRYLSNFGNLGDPHLENWFAIFFDEIP
jgi:hypothetical protein